MSRRPARYAQNPYADAASQPPPTLSSEMAWSLVGQLLPELEACVERKALKKSTGKIQRDYSVYTGLCGVALTYLRLGLYCRDARGDAEESERFLTQAREVAATCLANDPQADCVSFFCGAPGYLAIQCVASAMLKDSDSAKSRLQELLACAADACDHSEDELLFGRAGYLYAVLWARKHCGEGVASVVDFEQPLRSVAERLIATGQARAKRAYKGWPLMWHCFDEPYIGAAHGVVGILTMLFHCWDLLSSSSQQLVRATLEKLMQERFPSGNVPIVLRDARDEHVHWCHGAPGIASLFLVAADCLSGQVSDDLREAALKAGEIVWERGLILKGNGLCHGITGNAYTFLTLYRATGDTVHLTRASAFGCLLGNKELQAAIRKQPDPQRRVQGVPDSPQSLMEGSAGVVCFLLDVSAPDSSAFPGWEI